IEPDAPVVVTPWTQTMGEMASRWGSTVALSLVAIAGLFALRRGMKLPEPAPLPEQTEEIADVTTRAGVAGRIGPDGVVEERDEQPKSQRERVAAIAHDEPEAVAAVAGSWLRDAA
ncbi:MAG: hypothetical protein AAF907_11930, partial [Planctomycetota bacterium]